MDSSRFIFSVASAIFNVDRYLEEFLASLERQTFGIENLDIVLVDDGSTDESLATLRKFEARFPSSVRVFTKANGGQGSARNLALDHTRGEWVTFIDPDDFLANDYFSQVARFLEEHSGAGAPMVVATSLVSYYDDRKVFKRDHPMLNRYSYGERVVNLDIESDQTQLHCNCAFFRTEHISKHQLRFDDRIRPTFEDVSFVSHYLLHTATPLLGFVPQAEYLYRKRSDKSSAVSTSAGNPERYRAVPRYGLLGVLQASVRLTGEVPLWLQNAVLYDLAWAMKNDFAVESPTGGIPAEVRAEFHGLLEEILGYISESAIASFTMTPINDDQRFALTYGYRAEAFAPTTVRRGSLDSEQGLTQLRYRYTGSAPAEQFFTDGMLVAPVHGKHRTIEFLGRTVALERIVWVPTGNRINVKLNGHLAHIGPELPPRAHTFERTFVDGEAVRALNERPEHIRHPSESLASRFMKRARSARKSLRISKLRDRLGQTRLSLALHSATTRRDYLGSWVFMDRDILAGDNAEHLYRYVRAHHPEIKIWFILKTSSADWDRLKADGFNLVPYGSFKFKTLMLSAAHFASSHIDHYVIRPFGNRFGSPRWRFTFLQHGVIKDDLSRWLNPKPVDLFVTASPAEYESIVADGSPYVFTTKEVKLTGLPRHDALKARRDNVEPHNRDLILVMPTWRLSLAGAQNGTGNEREKNAAFLESEYAQAYSALLSSERLHTFARERSLTIAFMPHPIMMPYLADFKCPSTVEIHSYETSEVQDLLARGSVLVTDYSSMAFNAAAIDLPTAYFQFDQESFYAGAHVGRKGYFDYDTHGFGPVCTTIAALEVAVEELIDGTSTDVDYSQRMRNTFKHHDQSNSQRVFEAMLALDEPAALSPSPLRVS